MILFKVLTLIIINYLNSQSLNEYIISTTEESLQIIFDINGNKINEHYGYNEGISSVSANQSGKLILTSSIFGGITLYDFDSNNIINRFSSKFVTSVLFHPNRVEFITGLMDGSIYIRNIQDGNVNRTYDINDGEINVLKVSFCGRYLLSGSNNSNVKLIDLINDKNINNFKVEYFIDLDFNMEGNYIAVPTNNFLDNYLLIYDIQTNHMKKQIFSISSILTIKIFKNNYDKIITGSIDGIARIYSVSSGVMMNELRGHSDKIYSVDVSRDGRFVVTGSRDSTSKIFDTYTGLCIKTIFHNGVVKSVIFVNHMLRMSSNEE